MADEVFEDQDQSLNAVALRLQKVSIKNRERRPSDDLIPDVNVLQDLEEHAKTISSNLDMTLRDLRGLLRGVSDLSVESIQVFNQVICGTCESVDSVIRSFYTMVAKTEELNGTMLTVQKLARQINEIKRLVDQFEAQFVDVQSA
ncbi:unnamed protein product [Bursaphelenchus okinawaensis]|uniref:BLOC-1-related complex subunit 6 C-terminal helix domain-containing protein n=1 Tax=Bursaphelenchus okinawaensis TaxID=465554 RepID=A0A811KWK4_9BILA|nr:unnamed protein product [Bursaphelenchus okinawaensis]CAG9113059.1 unnamed protein product [Bursaphelenchus okinawaensis]